jgi:hypothetical protein
VGVLVLYRRVAVVVLWAAMVAALLEFFRHHTGHQTLATLLAASALLFWCTLDARIHDKTFHHGWALPFTATWPASLAIYLVWTRGWRRGLTTILGMVIAGIILVVAAEALSIAAP